MGDPALEILWEHDGTEEEVRTLRLMRLAHERGLREGERKGRAAIREEIATLAIDGRACFWGFAPERRAHMAEDLLAALPAERQDEEEHGEAGN